LKLGLVIVGTAAKDAPPYPAFPPNQLPDRVASVPDLDTYQVFVHSQHSSVINRAPSLEDHAKDDKVIGPVAGRASPICSAHCFQLLA
jgi:hypothetical protein